MSVELSIALLFSSKTIPSASSLKYVLYRWVTQKQQFHQGFLGGECAFRFCDGSQLAMETFNDVGRVDDLADLLGILEVVG